MKKAMLIILAIIIIAGTKKSGLSNNKTNCNKDISNSCIIFTSKQITMNIA